MDNFLGRLRCAFNNYIANARTIAEKIELDTVEGVRTNPLYIEMFSRFVDGKFADVHLVRTYSFKLFVNFVFCYYAHFFRFPQMEGKIFKTIEDVIHPLIPFGEEERIDNNTTSRKILFEEMSDGFKALLDCVNHYRSQPGPFDVSTYYNVWN